MNSIHVLDCTLRDGGYCNEWRFGHDNIIKIINGLIDAGVEIVECGFITNRVDNDLSITKYNSVNQITNMLPRNHENKLFVAMMNYGEFDIDDLPPFDGSSIDGIRVAFHKKDYVDALKLCKKIIEKGYLVFVQAMVSLSYSDEEFLHIIREVNRIKPYAFYIVDSFGMMKLKELTRLFYLVENNLDSNIWIGFHCHNNMQLAYSNAQWLTNNHANRNLIIDSSVYGMGRGAGNLNTELFIEYLNEQLGRNYRIKPILVLIDEIINSFYQKNYWGYSLSNYISASHNAHPNYASFLEDKNTLTFEGMNAIFDMMSDDKKVSFDKEYIERLYLQYMASGKVLEEHMNELRDKINDKIALLVAPGKNAYDEADRIKSLIVEKNVVVISVNFDYEVVSTDYIFVSNQRRFPELTELAVSKSIVTSNISAKNAYFQTDYRDLLNKEESVFDNAGLMAIRFLILHGIKEIYLAGFDGYSHDALDNYVNSELTLVTKNSVLDAMNEGMIKVLSEYGKMVPLHFLTTTKYTAGLD